MFLMDIVDLNCLSASPQPYGSVQSEKSSMTGKKWSWKWPSYWHYVLAKLEGWPSSNGWKHRYTTPKHLDLVHFELKAGKDLKSENVRMTLIY